MSYNTKNFTAQGGSVTVIGGELLINGKLTIAPGAEITGLFDGVEGEEAVGIGPAPDLPDSKATTMAQLRNDFNLLLAGLREAGILASTETASASPDEPEGDAP